MEIISDLINYLIIIPFAYFEKGGILIFPLFIISLILWTLIIERIFIFKQEKKMIENFLHNFGNKKIDFEKINNDFKALEKNISIIKILTMTAPLLGLLGTIFGLISTFKFTTSFNYAQLSSGISEALITTELGLIIALPGYFFQNWNNDLLNKYKLFFEHYKKNNYDFN